jgi:shikimate kinase
MERCWILVGMMGAGKSSVGRALAELSGRSFQDTDLLLQNRLGRSIGQMFSRYGEEAFRDHETSLLRTLEPGGTVLATGGGIVCREDNWSELRRLGTTVYLHASPDTLVLRLGQSKKKRPLLETEQWEERVRTLLESRGPFYLRADMAVDVDGKSVDEVARAVLERVEGL